VGNAVGATVGTGMGGSLGYFAFEQTPSLIDAIFPVDGNSGTDPNMGDPEWTFPTDGGQTIPAEKEDNTLKAGFGNAVLPILIGVGVIMALNKSKN
jgi:hypothetical protein